MVCSERYADVFHHLQKMIRGACEVRIKKKLEIRIAEEVAVVGLGNYRRYAIVETTVSVTLWKQCSVCLRAKRHYSLLWRQLGNNMRGKKLYTLITESYMELRESYMELSMFDRNVEC